MLVFIPPQGSNAIYIVGVHIARCLLGVAWSRVHTFKIPTIIHMSSVNYPYSCGVLDPVDLLSSRVWKEKTSWWGVLIGENLLETLSTFDGFGSSRINYFFAHTIVFSPCKALTMIIRCLLFD
ncbi:hypothetical protein EYC84_001771 [Monilinia fructicola]|uniref:Uncharacterized protein n=1 Tax=Monilinia fructicola TaxID=38448 RepID=A0A5M9JV92_MONFR|nr:hypothetical protein EYC84_001771 [Monilinia fructicola]